MGPSSTAHPPLWVHTWVTSCDNGDNWGLLGMLSDTFWSTSTLVPPLSRRRPVVAIPGKGRGVSGANLACVHHHTPRQTSTSTLDLCTYPFTNLIIHTPPPCHNHFIPIWHSTMQNFYLWWLQWKLPMFSQYLWLESSFFFFREFTQGFSWISV